MHQAPIVSTASGGLGPVAFQKKNVLIFPAGAENALEIHASLRHSVHFKVYGGSSVEDHASFAYDNYIGGMPMLSDPGFLSRLNELIRSHAIELIFPTHDTVAQFMAEHSDEIAARVVTADARTALICREKRRTFALSLRCNDGALRILHGTCR